MHSYRGPCCSTNRAANRPHSASRTRQHTPRPKGATDARFLCVSRFQTRLLVFSLSLSLSRTHTHTHSAMRGVSMGARLLPAFRFRRCRISSAVCRVARRVCAVGGVIFCATTTTCCSHTSAVATTAGRPCKAAASLNEHTASRMHTRH